MRKGLTSGYWIFYDEVIYPTSAILALIILSISIYDGFLKLTKIEVDEDLNEIQLCYH